MLKQRLLSAVTSAAVLVLMAACSVHNTPTPSLTGPSGLGTNITVSVSPDVLTQDGVSTSLVTVTATNSTGQPIPTLSIRLAVEVNGGITTDASADGSLSALNVVTNGNGQATAIYTAPQATSCLAPCTQSDPNRTIQIAAMPAGTDFTDEVARTATIRLIPTGTVTPPPSTGVVAKFTISPSAPNDNQPVVFDGSSSTSTNGTIVSYQWKFTDDGSTANGASVQHTFQTGGDFAVSLTVADITGSTNTSSQTVHVNATALQPPNITSSPASPSSGETVFFTSTTTIGSNSRPIVKYDWNFGDGATGSGQSTNHVYAVEGTYTVVLTISDDQGHTGSNTAQISVVDTHAAFTYSPAIPTTATPVSFDASTTRPANGRTIVTYQWTFGDGKTGTGLTTSHTFAAGTYTVTLIVTDSAGQTSTTSQTITVSP